MKKIGLVLLGLLVCLMVVGCSGGGPSKEEITAAANQLWCKNLFAPVENHKLVDLQINNEYTETVGDDMVYVYEISFTEVVSYNPNGDKELEEIARKNGNPWSVEHKRVMKFIRKGNSWKFTGDWL